MRRFLSWVVTLPVLVGFGLCLLVFDIAGRLVRPFSLRGFEYVMAALQRSLVWVFRLAGTRIEVERDPAVLPGTGYVVIGNHQSLFDIAIIGGYLFTNFPKYVAKRELARWIPAVSLNLRHGRNAIIDRSKGRDAIRAIRELGQRSQERNVSAVIFPEGTRSRDGTLGEFKRAGAESLLKTADRLPVITATIDGSWKLLQDRLFPVPYGTRVRLRVGAPIARKPGDAAEMLDLAEAEIRSTLERWRADG